MKKIITLIITLALLTACTGPQQQVTNNTIPTPPEKHYVKHAGADCVSPSAKKTGAGTIAGAAVVGASAALNIVGTILTVTGDVATGNPVAVVLDLISGADAL